MEEISDSVASSVVEDKRDEGFEIVLGLAAAGANAEAAVAVSKSVSRYFMVIVVSYLLT